MTPHTAYLPAHSKRMPRVGFGTTFRYILAVPFLAAGALLLTIGALIAGTSPGRRKSNPAHRDPNCALEPRAN